MISDISILSNVDAPASTTVSAASATPDRSTLPILSTGCADVVTDVKAYLATRTPVPRWELDRKLYNRLPIAQRSEVRRLQAAMIFVQELCAGKHGMKVQPACERALQIYAEFRPLKTFRGKFDAWKKSQDWMDLVNRAKAGPEWQRGERGLNDRFLDYVAARIGDFKRDDASEHAIRSIKTQWLTGRNHRGQPEPIPGYETNWTERNVHVEPDGWDSSNIRRQLKRRAKITKAVKALRHHSIAEARKFIPQVHGTRADLRFMELVQFDDVRCDFRVIDTERGQICDLWLLIARDVATTMLLGFGMRPALAREDGSQIHLKARDMKQLCGWLLETYGLPPWVMTWVLENGTATLDSAIRMSLEEMLGERINFQMASMIGGKSSAGYWEKAVGNSKAKAMLESLNRIQHIMASHFPGQIGATYGKRPAELIAREEEAMEIWRSHRAEDRPLLEYPVLTIPQARVKLLEIFRQQNLRTDHNCEGFEQVVEIFNGTAWVPATANAETVVDRRHIRTRMESPIERAAKLVQTHGGEWSRVSPEVMTVFYENSMRRRPVEDNGEIALTHEGKLLRFAPPSPEFAIAPETKCLCYFNENDPRFLTLTDGRGGILGTWLRSGLAKHHDHDAIAAAIRHSTRALNAAKDRATELASGELAQLAAMRSHNEGFVTVTDNLPSSGNQLPVPPVARALRGVAGEKENTKKQQKRREELSRIADEALEL